MPSSAILDIAESVVFDDSIESIEYHSFNPYNNSFKNNDEIRICINRQDLIVLPCESQILIEGTINKDCTFINNGLAYLFQDIRYELNGVEIDRTKNCGITTTMKGLISYAKETENALENSGWNTGVIKAIEDGDFSYTVPLSHLLGFAEDYRKVIMNAKHELVLNRTNTNNNAAITKDVTKHAEIEITRIVWRVPVIKVSDKEKLRLITYVERDIPIPITFRTWDLYEYPVLPSAQKHVWTIKTTSQLEKPRFIIIGLQTGRKNEEMKDMSLFDHCNLTNCKVYLNSQYYPYDSFSADFEKGSYPLLYDAFISFQQAYYQRLHSSPQVDIAHYKTKCALVVIDTSRQCDTYNSGGAIDIKVEMDFKKNVPANTTAYCLIINDSMFEYTALTGSVRKITQ